MCNFDKCGERGCLTCELSDCIRDDIMDDAFIEEPPPETDNSTELYEDRYGEKQGKRKYTKYKDTYWDDERHRKAREYQYRKHHEIPQEPRIFKCKGKSRSEYLREYRAQMPPEQKEKYLAWQREYRASMPPEQREKYLAWHREYNRKKREREKQEV